jgi:hypothetical protein
MTPAAKRTASALDIDPADLSLLGDLVGAQSNPLSPFQGTSPIPRHVRDDLIRAGVLSKSGSIHRDHRATLSTLATANRVSRVQLVSDSGVFEYFVYFSGDKTSPSSVKTVGTKLRIESPAATDNALVYLGEMLGRSSAIGTEFKAELAPADALVFAAFIDEHRRQTLSQLAGDGSAERGSTAAAIAAELERSGNGFVTMTSIVRSVTGMTEPASPDSIDESIASLISSGHIRRHGRVFMLGDSAVRLASRFTLVESVLTMLAIRASSEGALERAGFNCAISGVRDMLFVENAGDKVHIATMTARELLELTGFFLRESSTDTL